MKITIVLATLLGLAVALPATTEPPIDESSFTVDLSGLADDVLETRNDAMGLLEKRGKCPSQQTCVGRRCVMLNCMQIGTTGHTTTCITYKEMKRPWELDSWGFDASPRVIGGMNVGSSSILQSDLVLRWMDA
ncbi:MAG: hypothetical protein L6R41_002189 [Letrouitia leprolyta]|nr:MAG: hypothetical protein L6R41_002189 [Letrouitia leprolyta]